MVTIKRVGWLCLIFVAAAAAAVVAGCGGGGTPPSGGQASCTRMDSPPDGGLALKMCQELTGSSVVVDSVRQICMDDAGAEQFANGPCSRVGALGGCTYAVGSTVETVWYYADSLGPQTMADVQMICAQAGDTFVAP